MAGFETAATLQFLEQRFARDGYLPHQPIYGIESGEPGQFLRLARTLRLISWIEALRPESVLDLGAAEGYIANLIRLRRDCPVLCCDLSRGACERAAEMYGLPAIAGDLSCLPLKAGCADVVVMSEVFEHLADPEAGLSAALTYARRCVVFSTQELCCFEFERRLRLALADTGSPHAELNFVTCHDFAALFGSACALAPQFRRTRRRLLADVPREHWREHVAWLAQPRGWRRSEGIIALISVDGSPLPGMPRQFDPELLDLLIDGPPPAGPEQPPWDWLIGSAMVDGLVLIPGPVDPPPLHPLLDGKTQIFQRLHVTPTPAPMPVRQRAASLIPWLERIGYATCADPLPVKLRWLSRRPLA